MLHKISGRQIHIKDFQLSATIHRNNIKSFAHATAAPKPQATRKKEKKDLGRGQKLLNLARLRGYSTKELFKYDLVESSYLFDSNGQMTSPEKYILVKELEK